MDPGEGLVKPPETFNLAQYCLQDNARRRAAKTAMILARPAPDSDDAPGAPAFDAEIWSFAEFEDAVLRLAAGLLDKPGLMRGDRLMLRLENGADYALLFFAALAAGLVPLPSSSQLTAGEARFLLDDSGAAAIAMADGLTLDEIPAQVLVLSPDEIAGLRSSARKAGYAETKADDPAFLIYTSGTTGRPKGVLHAQRTVWGRRPMHDGWMGLRESDVTLHSGRFNWTYTLGAGLMDPWSRGATAALYDGPGEPDVWPRLIEAFEITILTRYQVFTARY
jgi:acyl-coenzyme A synthetase/AMP-(fatty) acid ligase